MKDVGEDADATQGAPHSVGVLADEAHPTVCRIHGNFQPHFTCTL
ncbi:MAG: hypothetical protein N2554_11560 [Fimbriimonadales bacterium]|nr:hypothetical protein [Fimbriimonadales bacterium]